MHKNVVNIVDAKNRMLGPSYLLLVFIVVVAGWILGIAPTLFASGLLMLWIYKKEEWKQYKISSTTVLQFLALLALSAVMLFLLTLLLTYLAFNAAGSSINAAESSIQTSIHIAGWIEFLAFVAIILYLWKEGIFKGMFRKKQAEKPASGQ